MELDFSIGGRKKVDVAIFHHGKEHIIENLGRAVLCRQEPNVGKMPYASAILNRLLKILMKLKLLCARLKPLSMVCGLTAWSSSLLKRAKAIRNKVQPNR